MLRPLAAAATKLNVFPLTGSPLTSSAAAAPEFTATAATRLSGQSTAWLGRKVNRLASELVPPLPSVAWRRLPEPQLVLAPHALARLSTHAAAAAATPPAGASPYRRRGPSLFASAVAPHVVQVRQFYGQLGSRSRLWQMHVKGKHKKFRPNKNPLGYGVPQRKGVVLKTLVKKPKKPNSANRKCVLLRLTNGKEAVAYVPGEGHNLQEHNTVLVRVGRLRDCPGVKLKCMRGKHDLAHVVKPGSQQ